MKFLNNLSDKKYAKYKNRLHYVYAQLYRTQIYKEYLVYKKHKNFQINDGILKINNILKKINKYNKDNPKIIEEISKITNKNQKRFLIYLFLKIFNSWKFLKNHGFILSSLSKYLYKISLTRIWKVKKKRYSNYIKTSFGSRKYTRRYFIKKGFSMKTLDDVRCWLFYFKKIGKTTTALQFHKKEFLFCNVKNNGKFLKDLVLSYMENKKLMCNETKLLDSKLKYSLLSAFWFYFFSFSKFLCNFFNKNNKFSFLLFLLSYFNFLLSFSKKIIYEKKNNILLKIKLADILEIKSKMCLIKFFINKETKIVETMYSNTSLCNIFSETKNTFNNFSNFIKV